MKRLLYSLLFIGSVLFSAPDYSCIGDRAIELSTSDTTAWGCVAPSDDYPSSSTCSVDSFSVKVASYGTGAPCSLSFQLNGYKTRQIKTDVYIFVPCEYPYAIDPVTHECVMPPQSCPEAWDQVGQPAHLECSSRVPTHAFSWTCTETPSLSYSVSCGLDSDNDGLSDEDETAQGTDPNNPDTDGDGHSDGAENTAGTSGVDPNDVPSDNLPPSSSDCNNYPLWASVSDTGHTGWVRVGTEERTCTLNYYNSFVDGNSYYFSSISRTACAGYCTAFRNFCTPPQIYIHGFSSCVSPDTSVDCSPDSDSKNIVEYDAVCYERIMCLEDPSRTFSQVVIDCPDFDNDGFPDDNITNPTPNNDFEQALNDYQASKETTQLDILRNIESSNNKLTNIDEKLEKINASSLTSSTSLQSIDSSIDSLLSSQNLANQLVSDGNSLDSLILAENEETNDLLTEIRDGIHDLNSTTSDTNISVDLNTSEITDLMKGENAELDYIYAPLNEGLARYSTFTLFPDQVCPSFDVVSGAVFGRQVVFLSQSTIDMLPMAYIRSAIIFGFALFGFILVFRGN